MAQHPTTWLLLVWQNKQCMENKSLWTPYNLPPPLTVHVLNVDTGEMHKTMSGGVQEPRHLLVPQKRLCINN